MTLKARLVAFLNRLLTRAGPASTGEAMNVWRGCRADARRLVWRRHERRWVTSA